MAKSSILSITNGRVRFLFSVIIIFSLLLIFVSFHSLQSSNTITQLSTSSQHNHVHVGHLRKANYSRSIGFLNSAKEKRLKKLLDNSKTIIKEAESLENNTIEEKRPDNKYNTFSAISNKSATIKREAPISKPSIELNLDSYHLFKPNENPIISKQVCKMPELTLFDPEIAHLFYEPEPLDCKGQTNTYVKNNRIYLRYDALLKEKYETCSISTIERESDLFSFITDPIDVSVGKAPPGKDVELRYKIDSDFLIIGCDNPDDVMNHTGGSSMNYEMDIQNTHIDIHALIYPSKNVLKHARSARPLKKSLGLNVIMFGVDSTSRLNFMRQMPKSYRFLTETLGSVVLKGYNIVGDATNGALTPMLTGKHEKELPEVRKSFSNSTKVNVYPFIWKEFKKAGYATLFGEDSPEIAAYNWRLNGFNTQPTDHYMRTFWQETRIEGLCLGPKSVHEIMLDYLQDFMFDYSDINHFGFMLYTGLTHADINKLTLMDENMFSFLKHVHSSSLLNNTVLIVFSDHGARYTKIRATLQGKLEERLPFMSISIPDWIKRKHPEIYKNLHLNSNRLTTPFDIHTTLRSILNYSSVPKHVLQRGLNLFHEVPLERSCGQAGVAPHWCACLKWDLVQPENDSEINSIAEVVVDELNKLVKPYLQHCAHIQLKRVKFAQRMIPNKEILTFDKTVDADQREPGFLKEANVDVHEMSILYQITVETAPGPGLFEATLVMSHDEKNITRYELTEEISRINAYGDQPKCIADRHPKVAKYCFCKNQLNSGRDI